MGGRTGALGGSDETRARIAEKFPSQFTEVTAAEITDIAGVAEFWDTRSVLTHIRDFARSRRVGPWALLGCVMVRVNATTHRTSYCHH